MLARMRAWIPLIAVFLTLRLADGLDYEYYYDLYEDGNGSNTSNQTLKVSETDLNCFSMMTYCERLASSASQACMIISFSAAQLVEHSSQEILQL